MTLRTTPELWQPPVQGVKALPTRKPSRRALMAQTQSAVALQLRYERWITWHYSRILNDMRRAFVSLDHIPDELEAMTIIAGFQQRFKHRFYVPESHASRHYKIYDAAAFQPKLAPHCVLVIIFGKF